MTIKEPEWTRPGSQEYITSQSPPTTVLEGVPGDPSSMEGGAPQDVSKEGDSEYEYNNYGYNIVDNHDIG